MLVNEADTVYEVVKVDELGNETVIHEVGMGPYNDVQWNFSNEGQDLVIKIIQAGGDASDSTEIAFRNGEERVRSYYNSYQPQLVFELPDMDPYTVELETSIPCKGLILDESDDLKTELFGIKISSGDSFESFNILESEFVPCERWDESFVEHHPKGVDTTVYGISFDLPNGDHAWISTWEGAEKIEVELYSM